MHESTSAACTLADYAHGLRYEQVPADVMRFAKACLIDAIGAAVYGHEVAAGEAVRRYLAEAAAGPCAVPGIPDARYGAEAAAFAGGVLVHAAELDSLRQPGAGVHPGAVLVPPALAAARIAGGSGHDVLTALVAGIEVLFRIGAATKHSAEARGFHAPGLTGPFGAAIVVGKLLGVDKETLRRTLGIAGSLGGGLLEFAKAGDGGLVKRIHLGRAAQAGIVAVQLARSGFDGPSSVLEGRYGFLHAYCERSDVSLLTAGLGTRYETLTLCLKRYACHIAAHTPVYAVQRLKAAHDIDPRRIASIHIEGAARLAANHDIKLPADLTLAQYSVPYCVAAALLHDADDPATFGPMLLDDRETGELAQRVSIATSGAEGLATVTRITLDDGTCYEAEQADFPGCPGSPLSHDQLRAKFTRMTRRLGSASGTLFERLEHIEDEADLRWLDAAAAVPQGART
ncbi:MmgE/PrpD family protein [Paraburkholderia sabiae]|uniref:MmgE/PrpD family protein n=1 Tax=Paraburkholderia sabiae TaxID=273251 RepID=UPI001CADF303|nr:MmgE/PrpD family protein [Paraburkholderia sabiae]CAG9208403.1 MmgE/PrpD family protein [Paraburkholderia sabiae]